MDGGETWQVCKLEHPEKPSKYGKYWCWCFWSLEVEVLDFFGAKEIAVRAWDLANNTQPENLNWNLMVRIFYHDLESSILENYFSQTNVF
jgi:nitrate reductase (NAD(P)H)